MRMISERCERLIVIFSNAFFQNDAEGTANSFFLKFAGAIGIEQKTRKIIPCMKENCVVPSNMRYYFALKYKEPSYYFDFWKKLASSITDMSNIQAVTPR